MSKRKKNQSKIERVTAVTLSRSAEWFIKECLASTSEENAERANGVEKVLIKEVVYPDGREMRIFLHFGTPETKPHLISTVETENKFYKSTSKSLNKPFVVKTKDTVYVCELMYTHRAATDIEWDAEPDVLEELPIVVEVPDSVDVEDIADYLSDNYGYCIKSLYIEDYDGKRI